MALPLLKQDPAPRRLVAATYNIHRCVGVDGEYHPDRIAAVIASLDADIIGLQEVSTSHASAGDAVELNFLAAATGYQAVATPAAARGRRHFGNALLTRFPITAVRRLELSVGRFEPRGALDVDLDFWGEPLRVIVTHLGLRVRERAWQIARLLEALGPLDDRPTLMMGDFNEWHVTSPALRRIHRRFGATRPLRTFPARMPMLPLDRIWAHPNEALQECRVFVSAEARVASDHLPLRAELSW